MKYEKAVLPKGSLTNLFLQNANDAHIMDDAVWLLFAYLF